MTELDNLLMAALNAEVKAEEFYASASSRAQSQAGKILFKELADFEHGHYERVKKIIDSRKKGRKLDSYTPKKMKAIKPEVKGEFEPNKDEIVDVLTLGIKAEKEAQERYNKIAKKIEDPKGREIFTTLAEDEKRHHDLLEMQFFQMSNKGVIIWE